MTDASTPGASPPPGAAADADLTTATALVTGAGSGIGRACAQVLAAAGAHVHLLDREAEAVRDTARETGGTAHVVDLAEAGAVAALPAEVDILVNNAGIQHVAPIHEFPPETFTLIQQVMVTAPFLLMRHCLPHMYARGWGRLINISSVHGLRASPDKSAYVAAKHALEGMSKVAALEGAARGVTSNCVDPGYVRTPLVQDQIEAQARSRGIAPEEVTDQVFLHRTAIKRLIEPEEVAALVGWLCSSRAGYITGASIPIDGAWTAH
ncbi:3-hydroxybutyrate dehydrogenase [Halopolyspora algeriensis]|uniref:3-hydroxybutyrate dehydrogenase n=1 Tax=Halopolyspora algeriensis TaxID=1500506 RepID=A0A368VWD2_9ACTN|nr:3-hydroxybutyrate dehydrogenase [Halopolyspora algeriensis]RCW46159.1 3-hydroxybutyrate dehydrogenase [Halopolyspora algeriensis]TQM55562.1 3-hydroxybutyrate dehydrogenase [Halopolyspora algeriensis]